MYSFAFSTSEKSDYQSHQTWKKAFTATSEPSPDVSGGYSDSNKESPDRIKALTSIDVRLTKQDSSFIGPWAAIVVTVGGGIVIG